jgi:hypothetical protein
VAVHSRSLFHGRSKIESGPLGKGTESLDNGTGHRLEGSNISINWYSFMTISIPLRRVL